ncbi:MAG TPA: TauD/TfdA family dioxygenase, partial [Burkholderiales bacterium]|nr:TauD/TfdA family dioxygenase [Burkholderiales bacterium]
MSTHHLDVNPLTGGMGAEIRGIDLSQVLDEQTFRAINQVLLDHGMIFFRGQNITPAQQMAFARHWGKVHLPPHMPCLHEPFILTTIIKSCPT